MGRQWHLREHFKIFHVLVIVYAPDDDKGSMGVISPRHVVMQLQHYKNPTRFSYYFTGGTIINSSERPLISKQTPYDQEKIKGGLQFPDNVNFGLIKNGLVLSRGVVDVLGPKLIKYYSIPMSLRHFIHTQTWCLPYIDNEINFGGCLELELGLSLKYLNLWTVVSSNSYPKSRKMEKQRDRVMDIDTNDENCTKPKVQQNKSGHRQNITLLVGVMGYSKDTKRSVAFFRALFKHKVYRSSQQFLFMHDDEGKMPEGIQKFKPVGFNLQVLPHAKVNIKSEIWSRNFAQLKYLALVLEAAKRMKNSPHLKHHIIVDNDVTINFLKIEDVLKKYLPYDKCMIGGTITYNYLYTGYTGGGVVFMTRKAVLSVSDYILKSGNFPGSLIPSETKKAVNPMSNIDIFLAGLIHNLGGEIVSIPRTYSRSPYSGYPLKYISYPIIAAQHSYGEGNKHLPQHDEVLEFMLNFTGA